MGPCVDVTRPDKLSLNSGIHKTEDNQLLQFYLWLPTRTHAHILALTKQHMQISKIISENFPRDL